MIRRYISDSLLEKIDDALCLLDNTHYVGHIDKITSLCKYATSSQKLLKVISLISIAKKTTSEEFKEESLLYKKVLEISNNIDEIQEEILQNLKEG